MKRNILCVYIVADLIQFINFSLQKWIGDHKRSKKSAGVPQPATQNSTLKKAKAVRGPSGYNLFCSDIFKSGKQCCFYENQRRIHAIMYTEVLDQY